MSRVRANKITNNAANGAPQLTFGAEVVAGVGLTGAGGINITGVATAASFSGNLSGNVTGNVTGTTGTFTGNVSVGGTLTYEDVTNVDSVGVITARSGIVVTGIVTATSFKGDGSALTGVSAGLASSTVTLQGWLFGGG